MVYCTAAEMKFNEKIKQLKTGDWRV